MSFVEIFQRMVAEERLPAVLLLHGPKGAGQEEAALQSAQLLLQTTSAHHVDLHSYYPEGKTGMHSIHSMKNLCNELFLSAHAGGYKCFIIYHAERMLPSNANALLKSFEEPPPKSLIFLVTSKPSSILPTIRSRAQSYAFHLPKEKVHPLQKKFLQIMVGELPYSEIHSLSENLDKERKSEESEGAKRLDKELTALQRERVVKEIEGRATLLYQEKRDLLFEAYLLFYRDLTCYHLGIKDRLFFPEFMEHYQSRDPRSSDEIEKAIQKARLAHDRGLKLQYCLEELITIPFG